MFIMYAPLAIRPSSALRTNYSEISKLSRQQPVAVTVNGKEDIVILSHEDYVNMQIELNRLLAEQALLRELAQAEDDRKLGRVHTLEEARAMAIARFKK